MQLPVGFPQGAIQTRLRRPRGAEITLEQLLLGMQLGDRPLRLQEIGPLHLLVSQEFLKGGRLRRAPERQRDERQRHQERPSMTDHGLHHWL